MMKMRIISLLLSLVMLAIVLTGCDTTSEAASQNPFKGRFASEYLANYMYVIIDKITGVCYLAHVHNGSSLTVLLDADGTPLTYSEAWHQVYGEVEGGC